MKPNKLSIIIPVYNSENTIGLVVTSLLNLYSHLFALEIILVEDGSKDNSRQACENLSLKYDKVTVIYHETNCGQQLALMTGLRHCRGDLVVIMDDDMQNPPSEVIQLINKINEGYEVVVGKRRIYNQSWTRRFFSYFNQLFVSMNTQQKISFSSFIIMKKSIVELIIQDQSPNPIIQGILLKNKVNMINTLTDHHPRKYGKSNYNLIKLFNYWLKVLPYYLSHKKRYILILLSIILILSSIYFLIKH